MPTYAYACRDCGHRFDTYQSFSDDSLTTCPQCGHESLRKVFDSVGISFKGSGFYSTDSRSSNSSTHGASSGEKSSGSSSGSSSTSGDTATSSGTSGKASAPATSE